MDSRTASLPAVAPVKIETVGVVSTREDIVRQARELGARLAQG